jgi:hypothetical protein
MSAQTSIGKTFDAAKPTPLFAVNIVGDYNVAPDGQRILIATNVTGAQSAPFTVALNWRSGLKRKE